MEVGDKEGASPTEAAIRHAEPGETPSRMGGYGGEIALLTERRSDE